MFSAKLTIILYILVFFELGAVLIVSPWNSYWSDNLFLGYLTQQFNAPGLVAVVNSDVVRWSVTALGVVNILLGVWEAFHYRQLVRLLVHDHDHDHSKEAVALSDH